MPFTSDPGNLSPARFTVRTDAGTLPIRTSSVIAEGTVLIRVVRSAVRELRSTAERSQRTMTDPPRLKGANSSKTDRSKQIDVEKRVPASS